MASNRQATRSLSALKPYDRNARTHTDAQVDQIASSISEFGWTNPILIDEHDFVIAGHGRLLAAKKLGMGHVPVIVLSSLSDAQKSALRLADNKLALNAGWDEDLLKAELGELRDLGFDLALTGFGELEIASLFGGRNDPDEEWQGMPEFEQGSQESYRSITVHFPSEEAVTEFERVIGQRLHPKAKYLWFPRQEREDVADLRYAVPDLHSV